MMNDKHEVGIVGCGFISNFHMQVLHRMPNIKVTSVVDLNEKSAEAFASKWKIKKVFSSLEEFIEKSDCDSAHVNVPPEQHFSVASELLSNNINVFLEKPMSLNPVDCKKLIDLSQKKRLNLGVNHNYSYHPAFLKAKKYIEKGSIGAVRGVTSHWYVPLRQLDAGQFSHWMFREIHNIIFEQGVHPISQICDIGGKVKSVKVMATGDVKLAQNQYFKKRWHIAMELEDFTAQLYFSVGNSFNSAGMQIFGDDGQITIDSQNNTCFLMRKTRWMDFFDSFLNVIRPAISQSIQGVGGLINYSLYTLNIKEPSDIFYQGLKNSIFQNYNLLEKGIKNDGGNLGLNIIEACGKIADEVQEPNENDEFQIDVNTIINGVYDYGLIGGTGFIGKKVVERILKGNKRALIIARNINMLPDIFHNEKITLLKADIKDIKSFDYALKNCKYVIHLAHGGGGETWDHFENGIINATKNIAEACVKAKVDKLVYLSTIASLYLGSANEIVTGKTSIDPMINKRPFYPRAKGLSENEVAKVCRSENLPFCILRPGVVIGEGGIPMHSGLGIFVQDKFCLGWNKGENPLPFVLVEDVAKAILLSCGSDATNGKIYNVVGNVKLNAKQYLDHLSEAIGQHIEFLPQPEWRTQLIEVGKWIIKRLLQKRKVNFPSYRDLKSRSMYASFDCRDLKNDTGWEPETDLNSLISKGIKVYGLKK